MEMISLSPLELNSSNNIRRTIPRPPHLRPPDYEDKYDFFTVFYDCFESADAGWQIFVGPPLLNLEPIVLPELIAAFHCGGSVDAFLSHLFCCAELRLRTKETRAALQRGVFRQDHINIQPNESHLFRGRKVLLTKSKDNDLRWIRDWVDFFARKHEADAVLFYDNASTKYGTTEIHETISSVLGIVVAVVVSWPYKFGPVGSEVYGGPQGLPWDSDYCQYGILEHARHRFLSHAEAVVNADIDELVLTKEKESVFALVNRSDAGYLCYPGFWIEGVTESARRERRHFDFVHRFAAPPEYSELKWTVAPRRCPPQAQWRVHEIGGMQPDPLSSAVSFRHFRALSTSWKYPRGEINRPNEQDYVRDEELASWMEGPGLPKQDHLASPLTARQEAGDDVFLAGSNAMQKPAQSEPVDSTWRQMGRLIGRLFGNR